MHRLFMSSYACFPYYRCNKMLLYKGHNKPYNKTGLTCVAKVLKKQLKPQVQVIQKNKFAINIYL